MQFKEYFYTITKASLDVMAVSAIPDSQGVGNDLIRIDIAGKICRYLLIPVRPDHL